ncbi:MAG TPA: hypothetical protein VFA43_13065 [Gemmatimonadaceae bacterium]|nr:hypothetical protein [Gemmatimonadaceae bacterium]
MSPFRTAVLASLVIAVIVVACTSPSSPPASESRLSAARARNLLPPPPSVCTGGNVSVVPCFSTFSAPANKTNDTLTATYSNSLGTMQGYDVECDGDGTVVLSCTPEDTQVTVPAHGNIHIKYKFATRVAPGSGTLSLSAEDLNNGNFAGSTNTINTH